MVKSVFLINEERSFNNTKKAILKVSPLSSSRKLKLFPDVKFLNDGPVTIDFRFFQVIK